MKKILFFIHDLGPGGAEKVLVNLVNNMDRTKFSITVMTLFDVGVNKKRLNKGIHYRSCFRTMFRGNSHLMKLLSPEQLHRLLIKDHYDIEVSYLEGPCARIISGCPWEDTKLVSWIHTEYRDKNEVAASFRNYKETVKCYNRFHQIVCVSEAVKQNFQSLIELKVPVSVIYNTIEYDKIIQASRENVDEDVLATRNFKMISIGKLTHDKGIKRLLQIADQLKKESYAFHLYILGNGPEEAELKKYTEEHGLKDMVDFLGYQENPYKYLARCDLYVCASYHEGFSTATAEALIVGTAVCTVNVSGMVEMLGEDKKYGVITENTNTALYDGIKQFMDEYKLIKDYETKAFERGKMFRVDKTVEEVEQMLFSL